MTDDKNIILGNSGKKADRKDDATASSRPGRGRYRNFPPTEPEIHRGGFVPLPRGHGGFVPIVDPRLEQRRGSVNESGSPVVPERKSVKIANYTVGKVERTTPLLANYSSMFCNFLKFFFFDVYCK